MKVCIMTSISPVRPEGKQFGVAKRGMKALTDCCSSSSFAMSQIGKTERITYGLRILNRGHEGQFECHQFEGRRGNLLREGHDALGSFSI